MSVHSKRTLVQFLIFSFCTCLISADNVKLQYNTTNQRELLRRIKAADIKSWMNATEDPCKDFYGFACGNWQRIQAAKVQEHISVGQYEVYNNAMDNRVSKLFTNLKSNDVIHNKIYDFLQSCKYVKTHKQQHKEDFMNLIKKEFGTFSILKNSQNKMDFNWWQTVASIYRQYDLGLIINLEIDYDLKSRNRTSIYVGKPYRSKFRTSVDTIVNRFKELLSISDARAKQIANDVHKFSEAIRNAGVDNTRSGLSIEEQYQLISITDFQMLLGNLFNAELYMKEALNITKVPESIYLESGGYFTDIAIIIKNTKPETIEHYIMYFLMQRLSIYTESSDFDLIGRVLAGYYFGKYIQHTIYEQFRFKDFENQIFELWQDIKTVFQNDLQNSTYNWISETSRQHAIKKLNNMKFKISSYDNENFEDYFKNLPMNNTNLAVNLHYATKQFKLHRGVQLEIRTECLDDVLDASFTPIYMPSLNEISLPVSFFQPFHIWHPTYPKAILYAHIGAPVGHEMIHAFDDSGRHLDADGNSNNWWDANAGIEYEKRRSCFQAQYHNYTFAGKLLPELKAQGENIADNAGMKIAYKAYKNWLEKSKKQGKNLDSEHFDNFAHFNEEQLFFIAFGQYRCQSMNEDLMADIVREDVHAPHRLRVIVPLSNFRQFSNVFHCKAGSPMNPSNKCEIF